MLYKKLLSLGCFLIFCLGVDALLGVRSSRNTLIALDAFRTTTQLDPVPDDIHRIVLMRHGESEFNNANIFTGWCDVALTPRGVVEANEAGQVFASHGISFRKCYSSLLTRSIVTAQRALETAGLSFTPIEFDWRLNERHYGGLQGLSKERTAVRLGRELVMKWRRSYSERPPLMTEDHPHYFIIKNDPRYAKLSNIPLGESLEDTQERCVEAWNDIMADIQQADGTYSLVVAHANTLRALVMHLDNIPADEIEDLNIPTAIPFYYDVNVRTGEIVNSFDEDAILESGGLGKFRGIYISDERKKRSFLERRRLSNDPWLWALHDHEVSRELLVNEKVPGGDEAGEGLEGLEAEAARNTEIFSSAMKQGSNRPQQVPKTSINGGQM